VRRLWQFWHDLAPVDQFGVMVTTGFVAIFCLLLLGLFLNSD